jgi:DNA-binding transcriptional regulator YbjK
MSASPKPSEPPAQQPAQSLPREASAIEADLQRLEDLSDQIERLRNALPAIVEPMKRSELSEVERIEKLRSACVQASEGLTSLRKGMTDESTQRILKSSAESLEKNSDLSKASGVSFYGYNDVN